MTSYQLFSKYAPAGDQPSAINELTKGINQGKQNQVLLGVTGSGKTFTMANIIANTNRPALILCHNKTLAAQLYGEMKEFFPHNAVEYFVSYYDYYQPEAYVAKTDTFIEKDSSINEQIDRMRHSATRSLLEQDNVIVVASVSCIFGIGSPETYGHMVSKIEIGQERSRDDIILELAKMQYERNDIAFTRGTFRVKGDSLDIYPSHSEERAWRVSFFGDEIEQIKEFDPLTGEKFNKLDKIVIYPNSHYVIPRPTLQQSIKQIQAELKERIKYFYDNAQLLESQRINQRTTFDIEMLETVGMCKGIENYSRYLAGTKAGDPPPTLFQYLPDDALLFVDESHVTVPQIGAMYKGDRARKVNLVEHGFRLPSALDNRPLKYEEWDTKRPQTIFVSATPGYRELDFTNGEFTEQVIRPTGLVDPECIIRPAESQVDDLIGECKKTIEQGLKVLVTTLTKKMAEDLTEYLDEQNIAVRYLHSDVDTLERIEIIQALRRGEFDVLVGINLLREGLDIPECGLVAILDTDKEGFLRTTTSLIQTIGRAARNAEGRVILYADKMTKSLDAALQETERRRAKQLEHNAKHGITPQTIKKRVTEIIQQDPPPALQSSEGVELKTQTDVDKYVDKLRKQMLEHAANLDFEKAASLRDEINKLVVG